MKRVTAFLLVACLFSGTTLFAAKEQRNKVSFMGKMVYEDQVLSSNIDLSKKDYTNLIEPDTALVYAVVLSKAMSAGRKNAIIAKFKRVAEKELAAIHTEADTVNGKMANGSIATKRALLKEFNKKYFKHVLKLKKRLEPSFKDMWKSLQKKSKIAAFKNIKIVKFYILSSKDAFQIADLKGALKSEDWTKKRTIKETFAWDTRVWYNTMFPADDTYKTKKQAEIRNTLIRTFVFLNQAGFKFRNSKTKPWKRFMHATSTILSHSGRVLVGVKKSAKLDKRAITNWLVTGKPKGSKQATNKIMHFKSRGASTHKTEFVKGQLIEKKVLVNLKNNYAFNVPLGGYGSVGADGSQVQADGRFGHYLIILNDAPKKDKIWQTAFQLGVEPTEPIFFTKPYACKGHLGTVHKLGGSEDMSIMNTIKWKDLCKKYQTVPDNYDCMRIEIETEDQFKAIAIKANQIINMNETMQKKAIKEILEAWPKSGV